MATRLKNIKVHEISLVDSPANQSAKVILAKRADEEPDIWWDIEEFEKREFSAEERRRDAKSGAAQSDGSFPIENASDLHNAMRAIGRSKNPEKTKAHIRARAKALGLSNELSDAFKSAETEPAGSAGEVESKGINMLEALIKALGLPAEATEEDVMKAVAERDAEIAKKDEEITKAAEKAAAEAAAAAEEIEKAAAERLAKAEKRIADLEEREEVVKFEKLAATSGVIGMTGPMLRKAYQGHSETVDALIKMIADAQTAVEEAGAFREIGTTKGRTSDDAYDELMVKAEELRKSQPHLSVAQAFEKVYTDPANGKLIAKERAQNRPNAN